MIANQDDELWEWLLSASQRGGGFVSAIADAGLHADSENYAILRPVLLRFKVKYPKYGEGFAGTGQDPA